MYVEAIWILLFISVQEAHLQYSEFDYEYGAYEDSQLNCSTTESIKGGHVTYSQGGLQGSVLTYHCDPGKYPFPVSYRLCSADGEWSTMRLANGRQVPQATCKDIMCPAQLQLDHGDFWPREQWFHVGMTQSFSCQEGFTLYGSAQRNCTLSGDWTGTTPACNNHADDCNDPGIPPGAQRSAGRFQTGEKVIYQCQAGLDLLGSAERVCLEDREWSGSTPRCQGPNTFDSPSDVAAAMTGSLAGVMDVISPDSKKKVKEQLTEAKNKKKSTVLCVYVEAEKTSFGRTFRVAEGSRMNVYILLDTSGSIKKQDFEVSRNATIALIKKLDSYEVQLKFHVLSFASEAIDIVDIIDSEISGSIDDVIWRLEEFNYHSHGRKKTGTNLHAALYRVSDRIMLFKQRGARNHFNETQNIIIIETDGYSNTGINPQTALAQIRGLLGYHNTSPDHTDETLLDVYVFGIGSEVKKKQLNSLASKKRNEKHVFVLKDYKTLGDVFNRIISDESVTMCGVAQEEISKDLEEAKTPAYTRPWHVTVKTFQHGKSVPCSGSIVSQNWVLTAAHCFARASTEPVPQQVEIKHGDGTVVPMRVIMHPNFNIRGLQHKNVLEFYDYDVALVQVNGSIPLSWKARPGCIEKALETLKEPTNVTLDEYIPDRFLCSGGSSGYQDTITCKGDSGGSLFLPKRNRFFQVGLVSWGTTDVCNSANPALRRYSSEKPPPNARDFHIDLFKIMPWLKQHLGDDIQFLPDIN
ncbi:hypothetical protein L3Q82_019056 [Scortum barcoo]|uniref:Uncharacterized protein n=1 Tax=Scortum barcoo TaxID=214431 RepID=A0ACB8VG16_9TELE|nr:hypothetical protein L3Q82_019056 [Scortum barcoo]